MKLTTYKGHSIFRMSILQKDAQRHFLLKQTSICWMSNFTPTHFTALQWFRVVDSQQSPSWTSTHYDDKLHCTSAIKLMDKLLLICNRHQLWYSCFNINNNDRLHCTSITVISLSDKLNFIRFTMMTGFTALQQPCVDHHPTNEQSSFDLQKTSTSSCLNSNTHWWQTSLHFSDLVSVINKLSQLTNRSSSAP